MSSLRELQRSLALRLEEVRRRDEAIAGLEREIKSRDRQIRSMQAELDKFRQILKPMTQQLAQNLSIQAMVLEEGEGGQQQPGRDGLTASVGLSTMGSGLIGAASPPVGRMKRVAISAEPTGRKMLVKDPKDLVINKIEKSDE